MTIDDPAPDARSGDDFPDWLRELEREIQPSRWFRLRLRLRRRARRLLVGAGAVLAVGLLVTAGTVGYGHVRLPSLPAYPTISPPAGVQATTTASPPPAAGPFDGTPAAAYPAGAAGITLPPAKPTGDFTAAQVAAGLAKVRAALVTARLDRTFITATDPEPLLRHFAPDARADRRADFTQGAFASFATRLAPGARLAPEQPRVKGRVTYRAARNPHGVRVLRVTTNFVWAYAFRAPRYEPGDGVVVVHDTIVWELPHPGDVRTRSIGLWLVDQDSYLSNIDCAAARKSLLRLPGDERAPTPTPTGTVDPDSLYDPDRSLEIPDNCGLTH
jgi:hypothetical protein